MRARAKKRASGSVLSAIATVLVMTACASSGSQSGTQPASILLSGTQSSTTTASEPHEFSSTRYGFAVTLPQDWSEVDASFAWDGKGLPGTRLTILCEHHRPNGQNSCGFDAVVVDAWLPARCVGAGLGAGLAPRGGTSGHHRDRRDRRQRRAEHSPPRPTSSPQPRRTTAAVLAGRSELGRGQSGDGDRAAPSRCALKPTDARHSMQSPRAARGGPNVQPRSPLCHRHEPDQEPHSFCQIRPPTNRR